MSANTGKKNLVTSAHVYTLTLVRLKWRQWNLNNLNNNIHLSTHKNYIKWDCICMKANRQTIWKNSITLHYNALFSSVSRQLCVLFIFNFILFFRFSKLNSFHFHSVDYDIYVRMLCIWYFFPLGVLLPRKTEP